MSSLERILAFTSHCLQYSNVSLEEVPSLTDLFKQTTKSNYEKLNPLQKEQLHNIYAKISSVSCFANPIWVKASIVYKNTCLSPPTESKSIEELKEWKESPHSNEREAYARLLLYAQTDRADSLDLSDLSLTRIPDCLLTDPVFAKVQILGSPLRSFPRLNAGGIQNLDVYNQILEIAEQSSLGRLLLHKEEIGDFLLNSSLNKAEIGGFFSEHKEEFPKFSAYLGFLLAKARTGEERNSLLYMADDLREEDKKQIMDVCFFYSPSFSADSRKSLEEIITSALHNRFFYAIEHLINCYICDIMLDEGLSPISIAGNASSCAEQYAKAFAFIYALEKTLSLSNSLETVTEKFRISKEVVFDSLVRVIASASFLHPNVKEKILRSLEAVEREIKDRVINFLTQVPESLDRKTALHMRYRSSNYVRVEKSCFEQRSNEVITEAVAKIQKCSTEEELNGCYDELFDLFGKVRGEIAQQDQTNFAIFFGQPRRKSMFTPLEGAYLEYAAKVRSFLQNQYADWVDKQKEYSLNPGSIEGMKGSFVVSHPKIPIKIKMEYIDGRLVADVKREGKYTLGKYVVRMPSDSILKTGRLPPLTCLEEMKICHTSVKHFNELTKDIKEIFFKAITCPIEELKALLAEIAYLSAYAAFYSRGSASITEWFIKAITLRRGLYFAYGTAEKKGGVIYRPTADLDALTSGFAEFEADFMEKASLSSSSCEEPSSYPLPLDSEFLILQKLAQLRTINNITIGQANQLELEKIDLLYFAIEEEYGRVVEELILIDEVSINAKNANKATPLFAACNRGHENIVAFLLAQEGIDVNHQRKDGVAPLMVAAQKGYIEIVKKLLDHPEINVYLEKSNKITALHLACMTNEIEVIDLLLKRVTFSKEKKEDFCDFARNECSAEVIEILKKYFWL